MFRSGKTTSGLNTISSKNVKETMIAVPSLALQNQFAAVAGKVEDLKTRYRQSLTDLEALYGALSQRAFKGELDLSHVPLPHQDEEALDLTKQAKAEVTKPLTFQLPAPENRDWLAGKNRQKLIEFWLNAWCNHYSEAPLVASKFMESAYQRLVELSEQDAFQFDTPGKGFDEAKWYEEPESFGLKVHEQIKQWVFQALADGKLTQSFNDTDNRIELKSAQA